jgi:hypothetical protein
VPCQFNKVNLRRKGIDSLPKKMDDLKKDLMKQAHDIIQFCLSNKVPIEIILLRTATVGF